MLGSALGMLLGTLLGAFVGDAVPWIVAKGSPNSVDISNLTIPAVGPGAFTSVEH